MATDGLSLYATITELQTLVGARIDKVQQPDKDILLLHVHGNACGRVKLLLNIHAENGRMQLTERSFENPSQAPAFCMLLRKHLVGCRILELYQMGLDRIAVFSLLGKNELYDEVPLRLVVELMGRHGNVFLLNEEGRILDCMRHFGISEDATRICLPNVLYRNPPVLDRLHPFYATLEELTHACGNRRPKDWMLSSLHGISKLCAAQIVSEDAALSQVPKLCQETFLMLSMGVFSPSVIKGQGVLPFAPQNAEYLSFPSMSEAQEAFYAMRDRDAILRKRRTSLHTVIEHARVRVERQLEQCVSKIEDEDHLETYRLYGELLSIHASSLRHVTTEAVVLNYYADPPENIVIPLAPEYSVSENAKRYFKRYQKGKSAKQHAQLRQEALKQEYEYLSALLLHIELCSSTEELNELKEELVAGGYLKEQVSKQQKSAAHLSTPILYQAPDGTKIRVGKNNRQNEQLLKSAHANHIWLHAKDVPASHVILETEQPSRELLALAAEIAAYHSKAGKSAQVAVDYTHRRDVKKPSGAKPGFVHYFNQHTIYITPHEERISPYRVE